MRRVRKRLRKAGPGFAIAYLFFLLFPHFEAVTHVHAEGARAHHHRFLSAHDLVMERAALEAVHEAGPQAARQGEPDGELVPEEADPKTLPLHLPGEGLRPEAPRAHTHFQEDPNLPVLAPSAIVTAHVNSAIEIPVSVPVFVPALAILASPARAPPAA